MDEIPKVKPTPLLWVTNFHGIARGILMYIAIKDEDQRKANSAILAGTLSTIIMILLYLLIMTKFMNSGRMMDSNY
jgi:hypothetical protein